MPIAKLLSSEDYPKQGEYLNKRVNVMFGRDSVTFKGVVVRDDVDGDALLTIIRLDDGRHVLSTECQYQPE